MKYPNFNEEKKLHKQGYAMVVGLDEAGRGPLAGPVVAGAIAFLKPQTPMSNDQLNPKKSKSQNGLEIKSLGFDWELGFGNWDLGVKDSKQLSEKKREEIYNILINRPGVVWGVGIVSEKIIDKINILEATKLAMQKAVKNLENKCTTISKASGFMVHSTGVDFLLLDGNFTLRQAQGKRFIPQKSIIKGDQKVFSISCASIITKVTRDRIMQKMHKKYPEYGFDKHKGYGTAMHIKNIKTFGACKIHRKTFYPISSIAKI